MTPSAIIVTAKTACPQLVMRIASSSWPAEVVDASVTIDPQKRRSHRDCASDTTKRTEGARVKRGIHWALKGLEVGEGRFDWLGGKPPRGQSTGNTYRLPSKIEVEI